MYSNRAKITLSFKEKAMVKVLPFEDRYKQDVRAICLATAGPNAYKPKSTRFLLSTFCDYYLEHEAEHCLVAVDTQTERAIGYILCAPCFNKFRRIFRREYFPKVISCGFFNVLEAFGSMVLPFFFKKSYPAHMHIDILPDYQGNGLGTEMTQILLNKLECENVSGIMLTVDTVNTGAIRFYKRMGFDVILQLKSCTLMAKKI